jgi:hypothetical protein
VPMLAEDIHLLSQMPRGCPEQSFFRSAPGEEGVALNVLFNEERLDKRWKRACANLGVAGVDLYGGTRHSSARALRRQFSPEQSKRATMHPTNQAFERHFQMEGDDLREIYAGTGADKTLIRQSGDPGKPTC